MSQNLFRIGELSRRTGVGVDVIRVWERRYGLLQPTRSQANFRLYTPDDVARLRLMRHYVEQHVAPSDAAELVRKAHAAALEENPGIPRGDADNALAGLRRSLERFDDAYAERLLRRLAAMFTHAVILRDVVLPYLRETGDRWRAGRTSVAQEHFASCFFERWMLAAAQGWGGAGNRRAVLACVPGEHHALGLLAFGIALRDLGWTITLLGRDTPLASARQAADAVGADAIVLAVTLSQTLSQAADQIVALARTHPVLIGGPAASHETCPRQRVLPRDVLAAAQVLSLHAPETAPRAA